MDRSPSRYRSITTSPCEPYKLTATPNQLTLVSGSARTTDRSTGLTADANQQGDGSVTAVLVTRKPGFAKLS